ncbi:MAG: SpaH/EbpB family LPXTG-anchored major pilin [Clostridia bacterium]|nr:SpaH/EbpB family LPXTG-anchored major pilin [Clostridia bacterium]
MKKISAIILALVLVMAVCAPAMAAASLTINGAYSGSKYIGYKVLDITSAVDGAYVYKAAEGWAEFFGGENAGAALVEAVAADGTITTKKDVSAVNAAELAKSALAYAKAKGISGTEVTAAGGAAAFTGLADGYYLVDSPAGALDILYNVVGDVSADEKHETLPRLEKVIVEGENEVSENTADIGAAVTFCTTVVVEAGGVNYIVHDKMADGFTYAGVSGVKIGGVDVDTANYSVKTADICEDCDFHVEFTDEYIAGLVNATEIDITYTAVLNKAAAIAGDGNENAAWLTYGESTTAQAKTVTYTGKIVIDKYDGRYTADKADAKLANAEFKLYKMVDGSAVYYSADANGVVSWAADGAVVTTDAKGAAAFAGLAEGEYFLKEITAPAGYNLLAEDIKVTISDKGVAGENDDAIQVANLTGSALPSTGGIGTTIFYVVGGLLMAAAVVLLVTRKKTSGNK